MKAGDDLPVVRRAGRLPRIQLARRPEFAGGRIVEARRHDADHLMDYIADPHRQRVQGSTAQAGLPESMSDDHRGCPSDASLVVQKAAAQRWQHAHDVEELARYARSRRHGCFGPHRDRHGTSRHLRHGSKTASAAFPVVEIGLRDRPIAPAIGVDLKETDDAIGRGIGQGAEQDAVDDAEHGRRRADAEPKREDRDGSKRFGAAKDARAVADVAEKVLDRRRAKFITGLFLHVFDSSKRHARTPPRLGRIQSVADVLGSLLVDVEANLLVESVFDAAAADEPAQPAPALAKRFHDAFLSYGTLRENRDLERDGSIREVIRGAGPRSHVISRRPPEPE